MNKLKVELNLKNGFLTVRDGLVFFFGGGMGGGFKTRKFFRPVEL